MPRDTGGDADVLTALRSATATEHEQVESTLGLMDPHLGRDRLVAVLVRLHAFWVAAEAGLDAWASRHPADAAGVSWARRRRAHLFADDLRALGAGTGVAAHPELPAVEDTDQALGRLYVLEGATLGGTFIARHLATLPTLGPGVRLGAFSPYGAETGAMWHAYRRVTRARVADGGDAARLVQAARTTFGSLASWCTPQKDPVLLTPRTLGASLGTGPAA
ncbi:biliverdin-producing heme oxygenase [Geodermatophilus sp. DSM 44513]|uniref:biliverdin-producing heme oxygenase n=1 Tax=Geodermatophilus sp. DSM 44513 TaxID=1528104 RepID=UPI0028F73DD2|nr:biliverdin-producing heme oxygenase [Geodermatophilus sp. DSM 44513]WNV76805.1 biliverdin-producing heme oxygenase [Geodermatophilus sp. DSM 44513]